MKNEIRYIEVMIALSEDGTLYKVLPARQEKQLLGAQIVEYGTELLNLRPRRDARRRKPAEEESETIAKPRSK